MNQCIYLKGTDPALDFISGEHIFPAGIGGIKKLPLSFVSHKCNNDFSKMELKFMRHSYISLPRQMYGPGKRGSLELQAASRSEISIVSLDDESNSIGLGYIKLGTPYFIPQFSIELNDSIKVILESYNDNIKEQINELYRKLDSLTNRCAIIEDKKIGQNTIIFGYEKDRQRWRIALSNKDLLNRVDELIGKLREMNALNPEQLIHETAKAYVNQNICIDDSYFRVCAKIVFNFLADIKGQEYVLRECFDPIRNWIVDGGENYFSYPHLDEGKQMFRHVSFPELSHRIMIYRNKNTLQAYISFYGESFNVVVNLCQDFTEPFELDGYICDWKNQKEIRLITYFAELQEK